MIFFLVSLSIGNRTGIGKNKLFSVRKLLDIEFTSILDKKNFKGLKTFRSKLIMSLRIYLFILNFIIYLCFN